ncbi:hypothetical protein DSO57_1021865 [Entomophthora muscae]|uniref:Uncharacterized protein n=1 Tax=Entomophthora muscae TaxID=34485 RepID=A0ACC2RUC1_9FUNG|nr:hypothetical protein DSO57_1021865 [Entomophthora muscae]
MDGFALFPPWKAFLEAVEAILERYRCSYPMMIRSTPNYRMLQGDLEPPFRAGYIIYPPLQPFWGVLIGSLGMVASTQPWCPAAAGKAGHNRSQRPAHSARLQDEVVPMGTEYVVDHFPGYQVPWRIVYPTPPLSACSGVLFRAKG